MGRANQGDLPAPSSITVAGEPTPRWYALGKKRSLFPTDLHPDLDTQSEVAAHDVFLCSDRIVNTLHRAVFIHLALRVEEVLNVEVARHLETARVEVTLDVDIDIIFRADPRIYINLRNARCRNTAVLAQPTVLYSKGP